MRINSQQNCVTEVSFVSTKVYTDPYNDVDLDVILTLPAGNAIRIPAFWAGDNVWKARLALPTTGEWSLETVASVPDNAGLHGRTGTVSVSPYTGANDLLRHGRVRVAEDTRHFEHADGTPFFWVGDTWWMGLTTRLPWPDGFKELAADRVAKEFNVIQIIGGPYPDMDAWDPRGRNEAGHPFAEGFASINPAYYDHADLKIAHLVASGLMPCIVGMWGFYLPQIGVEKIKRFWRHLIARYGAYPVAWCIAGEGIMPYYLSENPEADSAAQKKGWTEVMAHVRETDGYHNMISIHPCDVGRNCVEDDSLMDFEMVQTGHGDVASLPPTIDIIRRSVAREPHMPIVNSEVNYEGILGYAWQNVQRANFYLSAMNGTAGHTYGANGIWQFSCDEEPYGPSPHGRCWGNRSWREASQLPGSQQTGYGGRLMRRVRWWELEPQPEWVDAGPTENNPTAPIARGVPGKIRVIYASHSWWEPVAVKAIESDVAYSAYYYDPCTGKAIEIGAVEPDAEGSWQPPIPPECHDWILVMEA